MRSTKSPTRNMEAPMFDQYLPNVNKKSTKGQQKSQQKSQQKVNKFLSWIRKPESLILDKKTGKSDLG